MSNFEWQPAKTLKQGNTVRIAGYDLLVTDVKIKDEDVSVTTQKGHNNMPGQIYKLKTWQDVEIKR